MEIIEVDIEDKKSYEAVRARSSVAEQMAFNHRVGSSILFGRTKSF